jgi:16S rRNA (guanine527-N7)-methyltransferase
MSNLLFDPETLPEKAMEKLRAAEELYTKWNKSLNLVSELDQKKLWERHIVDSLQSIPYLKDVSKLADMGSGVGFPAVPLAIACPEMDVFAIEPIQKKCALLHELIREIRLPNLHVQNDRTEKVFLSHMDVVICRAFGEFHRDAKLAYKMLKPGGMFMTHKAAAEPNPPDGYERHENHAYQLPSHPKRFYIVIAHKAGEM